MTQIEFRLTMPGRNTWDGRWTGDDRNYTLVRDADDSEVPKFDGKSWSYSWPDGWRAEITARVLRSGEPVVKSHGFCGYDWMVASIFRYGKIYADHQRPEVVSP
jgi:hypothetical protein